jgi:hypothetical protein
MAKKKFNVQSFLKKTIDNNRYVNFHLLPFDYESLIKSENIQNQILRIKNSSTNDRNTEKDRLQDVIYTELYKLNLESDKVKDYFQKAILTDKFKNYLGQAFKFGLQFNKNENPYLTTFIHLAQFFIADICYEFLWHLENDKSIEIDK